MRSWSQTRVRPRPSPTVCPLIAAIVGVRRPSNVPKTERPACSTCCPSAIRGQYLRFSGVPRTREAGGAGSKVCVPFTHDASGPSQDADGTTGLVSSDCLRARDAGDGTHSCLRARGDPRRGPVGSLTTSRRSSLSLVGLAADSGVSPAPVVRLAVGAHCGAYVLGSRTESRRSPEGRAPSPARAGTNPL